MPRKPRSAETSRPRGSRQSSPSPLAKVPPPTLLATRLNAGVVPTALQYTEFRPERTTRSGLKRVDVVVPQQDSSPSSATGSSSTSDEDTAALSTQEQNEAQGAAYTAPPPPVGDSTSPIDSEPAPAAPKGEPADAIGARSPSPDRPRRQVRPKIALQSPAAVDSEALELLEPRPRTRAWAVSSRAASAQPAHPPPLALLVTRHAKRGEMSPCRPVACLWWPRMNLPLLFPAKQRLSPALESVSRVEKKKRQCPRRSAASQPDTATLEPRRRKGHRTERAAEGAGDVTTTEPVVKELATKRETPAGARRSESQSTPEPVKAEPAKVQPARMPPWLPYADSGHQPTARYRCGPGWYGCANPFQSHSEPHEKPLPYQRPTLTQAANVVVARHNAQAEAAERATRTVIATVEQWTAKVSSQQRDTFTLET
jgi:hypothetical protein